MATYTLDPVTGQYIETTTDSSLNITTDQLDYAPGSTATFTATNVALGGTVEFSVAHLDAGPDGIVGTADDGLTHDLTGTTAPWIVVDGGAGDLDGVVNGIISTSWYVNPDALNQAFQVSATEAAAGQMATASFTDAPAVSGLFDWQDGPAPDAASTSGNSGDKWNSGGDLNNNNSHFFEGDDVPFRYVFNGLAAGTYTVTIEYDTTKNGKHAFDYLSSYNTSFPGSRSETVPDPTAGTSFSGSPTDTFLIPTDPNVTGAGVTEQSGSFSMWGGDITAVSTPALVNGTYAGDSTTAITVTFTMSASGSFVLAWGAHVASESDWGAGSGAFHINGSPYHVDVVDAFDPGTPQLQMQANAIIVPPNPTDTLSKEVLSIENPNHTNGGTTVDQAGDVIHYAVTLVNTGNEALHVTNVADSLPGVSLSLASGDTNTNGVIDVGETWVWNGDYTVTQTDLDNNGLVDGTADGIIHNVATITTTELGAQEAAANTDLVQDFALSIVKDGTVADGHADSTSDVVAWTIDVSNAGNAAVSNVQVTDTLADAAAVYVSGDTDLDGKLDVGETWHYTASHAVTQDDLDAGGNITNIATATGDNADDVSDDASVPVEQTFALSIVKDGSVADGHADSTSDVVAWTIDVSNAGNAAVSNVQVTDTLADAAAVYVSGDTDLDGKLDVGETWHYTASHAVTQDDLDAGGNITNIATATGDNADDVSDDASVPVEQTFALSIVKDGSVADGHADSTSDVVAWTIDVSNAGNAAVSNVQVTDTLADAAAVYVSGDTDLDGKLDVGETWHYTASHAVTQDDLDAGGNITNIATATGDNADDVSDDASVPVEQTFALSIVKDGSVADGHADSTSDVVAWTIDVSNAGNAAVSNVQVTDTLADAAAVYVSGDTDLDGKLDVGETWHYTASHAVTQDDLDAGGNITNIATATGDNADDVSDDASVPVEQTFALSIVKDGSVADGHADSTSDVVAWTIDVSNAGNAAVSNVQVTDTLADAAAVYVSGDTDLDGKLDVGETWHYTASHAVTQDDLDAGGNITNIATATGDNADDVSDDASVPVEQNPDVTIDKTASVQDGHADQAGDIINYTVIVTNDGNVTLTNVVVTDSFEGSDPATILTNSDSFDALLHTGNTFVETGGTGVNGDGILDVGETWTYTYQHVVSSTDLSTHGIDGDNSLDNIATVTTTAPDLGPISDDASIPVLLGPGVRTPGFWSQTGNQNNNWVKFWDGIVGNEGNKSGTSGFPNGEITQAVVDAGTGLHLVDTNGNGVLDGADAATPPKITAGLLIGDFNLDGIQDNNESTFFINFNDALSLLNANQKQLGNAEYQEGRALVATWLNYLAGNPIEASDPTKVDAKDAIQWGVNWMLSTTHQTDGNITLNDMTSHVVSAGSTQWNVGIDGPDADGNPTAYATIPQYDSTLDIPGGVQILGVLDEYNNHGTVYGTVIATTP